MPVVRYLYFTQFLYLITFFYLIRILITCVAPSKIQDFLKNLTFCIQEEYFPIIFYDKKWKAIFNIIVIIIDVNTVFLYFEINSSYFLNEEYSRFYHCDTSKIINYSKL